MRRSMDQQVKQSSIQGIVKPPEKDIHHNILFTSNKVCSFRTPYRWLYARGKNKFAKI